MQPNDAEKQEKSERGKRSLLSEHGAKFDTDSGDFTPPQVARSRYRDHFFGKFFHSFQRGSEEEKQDQRRK